MEIITLSLPEYTLTYRPDYALLGKRIDVLLESHFAGKIVAIRALSLTDHPDRTRHELIEIIKTIGTDKYDRTRKGVAYEEFAPYHTDLQASPLIIGKDHRGFGADIIKKFYENTLLDRGYRLRIDLLVIYDLHALVPATKIETDKPGVDPRLEKYLFRFKDPDHKADALCGIITIL